MPDEDLSVRQQMNGGLVRGGAGNRTQLVEYNATVALGSFRTIAYKTCGGLRHEDGIRAILAGSRFAVAGRVRILAALLW